MTMFSVLRSLLFKFNPEHAHTIALKSLQLSYWLGLSRFYKRPAASAQTVMGLSFPHSIGLAAGFDKNGDYIDALASLGFGFIEIGTVTPKPQTGNPKPRLFRLESDNAIINRMGFNNKGMHYVAEKLKKSRYKGILGINIGKNFSTVNEHAIQDYLACFQTLAPYASYITINISSPNTLGLRDLQQRSHLSELLMALKLAQTQFANQFRYVPLLIKISPDLSKEELNDIIAVCLEQKIDGVIATNTTIKRDGIAEAIHRQENGGLSGKPLQQRSTAIIKQLYAQFGESIPIIASGGVMDAAAIQEKFTAGAKLVQVYTGFIYSGPGIIACCDG
jgi:dihydroorotate dehydrogenase